MKEATGEVSFTLIVIVAAAAVLALFYFLWPTANNFIKNKWGKFTTDVEIVIPVDNFIK